MDDLIVEFITETTEGLATLDNELVKLEQNPDDPQLISSIFRLMHTIKGTCGFLSLPRLESTAHAGENVLGKMREGVFKATPEVVSLILEALDRIKMLIEYLGANGSEPEGNDDDLKQRLNYFADNGVVMGSTSQTAAPSAPAVEAPTVETTIVEADAQKPAEKPVAAPNLAKKAVEHGLKAEPAKEAASASGSAVAEQTIRVNIQLLEGLMQMVGELVLTRNQLMQIARNSLDSDSKFGVPLQRLSSITSELQEGVMKSRMQPIGNAWSKFPRLIRDLSVELGKKIDLKMVGADTELDRQILELIKDPLTHMVRNSVDHGLEIPSQRIAAGKSEVGTLVLSAYHEGGHIIIEIRDDGRGLNIERIKEKAIANGLITEAEMALLSDQQIIPFIFKPGFSTAEKVTSVSGRGVGMDVVRTNIEKIGGSIDIKSFAGKGSVFYIKIPLTLAIVSVLILEAKGKKFSLPQISVNELVKVAANSEYQVESINNTHVLRLRDRLLPLISLSEELKLGASDYNNAFVVVCHVGSQLFGIIVDKVFDTEEIVVKPVAPILKGIDVYSGCTILGDGSVIMILDPNGLAKRVGEIENTEEKLSELEEKRIKMADKIVNFLTFRAGPGSPKAVPLELVSRIEELDAKQVEYPSGSPVVQYRGELMKLLKLDNSTVIPTEGIVSAIVFTFENKSLGLVVDEILDIVEERLEIKMSSSDARYIGSAVIASKTTDILDSGYVLTEAMGGADAVMKEAEIRENDGGGKILLVDDSSFFRNMTGPYLRTLGYEVQLAENGEEAYRILEGDKFDLVISDIEMPVANGYDLAKLCKANPALAHIPLIAYTTRITKDSIARGMEAGFMEYIAKTDREALIVAVRNAFNEIKASA